MDCVVEDANAWSATAGSTDRRRADGQWSSGRRGAGDAWGGGDMRARWCDAAEHTRLGRSRVRVEDGGR